MQLRSIRWRLVMIYVLLVIIVMMASGTLIVYLTRDNEYKVIENDLIRLSALFSAISAEDEDAETLEKIYMDVLRQNKIDLSFSDSIIYMLRTDGEVIYTTSDVETARRILTPQTVAAGMGNSLDELDRVSNIRDSDRMMGLALPIKDNQGQVAFVLYFLKATEQVEEGIQRTVYVISISVLLAIVLAMFLGYIFSGYLTKPIRSLSRRAKDMAAGNLKNPIPVLSDDEIGDLTENFNYMAKSLNHTLEQMAGEKNKMETIINYMTDGILVFDENGLLIHKNPASIRMLDFYGAQNYEQIFAEKLQVSFADLTNRIEREQLKFILEKDNQYHNLVFARYFTDEPIVGGVICVIQDVTEHKKLEQIQKEFVANVSHELRTPITTVKSYAETLLDLSPDDTENRNRFLQVINSESDRMTTLVQDLLELSKLDNKKLSFQMEKIKLTALVKNEVEHYQIHADKKNQTIHFESQDEYIIYGDAGRVSQVFRNLISNAVKYSGHGSQIEVLLYEQNNFVVGEIRDQGMGIAAEDLPRIFERFYRVDKARSRAMGGTGLGLAIVDEIMQYHGGKIEAVSELGKGSCFYLYFPR
ncbi:HAMP domain-containing protein [Clostridiales bacterium COT073_COT-073]|nr:HAMP domain-containing protein [Clostridiales bacterium COT073_COT-073]